MAKNTIKLKKYLDIIEEYVAVAAITPGMLVELTSADKVQKHSTASGNAVPMFALEDELQGKGIADAYAADDQVQVWVAQRGEQVNALLADGEDASIGEFLCSNGDGFLKCYAVASGEPDYYNQIVAIALEAINRSTSSGGDTNVTGRIKVMVV